MNAFHFFSNHAQRRIRRSPETYCPNVWGEQEYGGAFHESTLNDHVNFNNILRRQGWIQAYIAEKFEGIYYHASEDLYELPTIHLTYRSA